jgi:hypothetical protein
MRKRLPKRLPKHLRPATPLHRWKVAQRHYQMLLRLSFVALHQHLRCRPRN